MFDIFDVDIPINAEVQAVDGMCGHAICVIVDPIREQVTHLVVEENEPPRLQRLVPIELVHGTRNKEIEIKCGIEQFKKMDTFIKAEFLLEHPEVEAKRLWPFVEPDGPLSVPEHEKIPAGEIVIRRGTPVHAADGLIGQVDELMVDRKSGSITHLVLREGHLWGHKDIAIPVSQIEKLASEGIFLKLAKKDVEVLPEVRIRRFQG